MTEICVIVLVVKLFLRYRYELVTLIIVAIFVICFKACTLMRLCHSLFWDLKTRLVANTHHHYSACTISVRSSACYQ